MSRKRFAVLGLGQFGRSLSRHLVQLGHEVLAVDCRAEEVERFRDEVTMTAVADIRDPEALGELLATSFDGVVIAIGGNLEASILAALHLKDFGIKEIWAEANTEDRAEVLRRVGATRIFSPERDTGRRVAQQLANPNLIEFLPLSEGYGVVEVKAPEWTRGKTLGEMDLRNRLRVAVIAVRDPGGNVTLVPGGATRIEAGDIITVVGSDEDIGRFREGP